GRHTAASMVEMLFLVAMPFGMVSYGERMGNARAGVIGGLLFYLAPVAGKAGTIAYVDVGAAAVVFGAFYLVQIWREERRDALLIPLGLAAGFCYACKITASIMTVYAVVFVAAAAARRSGWKAAARSSAIAAAFAFAVAGLWMVKDAVQYGNPFFPLFNRWFPNPYQYPIVEAEIRRTFSSMSNVPYSQIAYQLTTGGRLAGIIGPIFLLAPLTLLALRNAAGRQLLLAFAIAFVPYFSNTGARFALPSLPFLSMALAMALLAIPRAGPAIAIAAVAFHGWISWPGAIERVIPGYQWRIDPVDLRAALRIEPEPRYFDRTMPDYRVGLMLDRYVPPDGLVFSLAMGQTAYHHRRLIGSFESTLARRAFATLITPLASQWSNRYLRDIRFAPVTAARVRLRAGNRFDGDVRIGELRIFNGDSEIQRNAGWRLTASRNPWEAPLAFDNDSWSWWTSGDVADPKTWIEVDLPKPASISRIAVDQIEDQRWIRLIPEVFTGGAWKRLEFRESDLTVPPPDDLRMCLHDDLKAMGVGWVLARDGSLEAEDLRKNSLQWGAQQVASVNGFRLWKLL
ncbi:MAG: hypothetical protein KGN84_11030, partial [Acidobacteriota bacterium]|nr:hypothetical protein [Acidobacteriota bacterium]